MNIPHSNEQVIRIAIEKARLALISEKAQLGVGFSQGVLKVKKKFYTIIWCAIITSDNEVYTGGGLNIELPDKLIKMYKQRILSEEDIEEFIESIYENPYERLVEYAMISLKRE